MRTCKNEINLAPNKTFMESWNQIIEIDDPWNEKDLRDKSWILIEIIWTSSCIRWALREYLY